MKKTLLATAIVSAIAAMGATSSVQAATVYDQDGTKLDIYGRIAMGIRGGGPEFDGQDREIDNGAEFVDVYSRLGLRMSHEVTRDLTAFGRLEWRFDGDEANTDSGFSQIRQSYIGLESAQFGTIQGGNFDSFYNQFVSLPFDVYIDQGLKFAGHPKQSRGDSIGYYTPDLSGFTAYLQLKHYSERGAFENPQFDANGDLITDVRYTDDEANEVAAQGGVRYAQGPVTVGLGFVDDVVEGGGNDEMLYGLIGSYDITDQFTARLGYEGREDNDVRGGGFDTFGIGASYATGPWAFNVDYYNIDRDDDTTSNAWAAGSYYKVSSNFDVFVEVADGDAPNVDRDTSLGDLTDNVYWLTGARYHF
ncbi:porin [Vreelandella venusta]|uniref:porin n=1 Tax=Vreelandella venusta TaxID=44935 RepID=UPI00384BC6F0